MKINKYYPFAFIYFFVNIIGLPLGILYTTLLTPLFYTWLVFIRKKWVLLVFFAVLLPFTLIHLLNGVNLLAYVKSVTLLLTVYIFCYAAYCLFNRYRGWNKLFIRLLWANFALTLLALILILTPFKHFLWTFQGIADNLTNIPRLRMLTYEPSYYSTLLVPLYFYFFLKVFFRLNQTHLVHYLMICIPLILSFSMGVLSCITIATVLFILIYAPKIFIWKKRFYLLVAVVSFTVLLIVGLLLFYPNNPLFVRIDNILAGADTSGNGRTYEAFYLAYKIAHLKSTWWGIGLGQIKIIGDPVIRNFYHYPESYKVVSIPCGMAETLAIFGLLGSFFRLVIAGYLLFKTNVFSNYYCTLLFFFVFIYQFTGSYITNIAEYTIWILAFNSLSFPEFTKSNMLMHVHNTR